MKKNKNKSKMKIKKFNIFLLILTIILLVVVGLNTYLILKFDILPSKFLIVYFLLIIGIPLLLLLFLFRKKAKKKTKITLSIIIILLIILLGCLFFYLNKTYNFIDAFTSEYNYETKNYSVVVLKNSKYQEIKDLDKAKIGYLEQGNIDSAVDKLYDAVAYQKELYKDYTIMLKDLDDENIQAFMVLDTYYDGLVEENEDFEDKHRIIYKFSITEKTKDYTKKANVTKETFNIYISGIDTYNSVSSITRSDVNILVSVNPRTNQILMVNIPRDYYVTLPDYNQKDKLTHAGLYGIEESLKTIESLLDVEINYYAKVNYNALTKLVDTLGGVDVYSKYSFTSLGLYFHYKKGYNHVNGEQALEFVRTRKAFQDGDRVRGENQQAMIQAIIKKAISPSILTKYTSILSSLEGSFVTNMSTDEITEIVKMQLDKMPSWNITSISLDGSDGNDYTYTYPYQKLYVMIPKEETIETAKKTLEDVKNGIILDSSYEESNGEISTPTTSKPASSKTTTTTTKNQSTNTNSNTNTNNNSNSNNSTNNNSSSENKDNVVSNEKTDTNTSSSTPSVESNTKDTNDTTVDTEN